MGESREGASDGYWQKPERNPGRRETTNRYLSYLEKYVYLKETKYERKKEQLYLCVASGLCDEEIDYFFEQEEGHSAMSIDFQRMLLLEGAGLEFIRTTCKGHYCCDEIFQEYMQQSLADVFPVAERIRSLQEEKKRLTEEFRDKVGFLLEKLDYEHQIAKMDGQHKAELIAKDLKNKEQEYQYKFQCYEEKIGRMEKEKEKLRQENARLKNDFEQYFGQPENKKAQKTEWQYAHSNYVGEKGKRKSWNLFQKILHGRRKYKERQKKKIFIQALQKNHYDDIQLQILFFAYANDFDEQELQYLLDTQIPIDNIILLVMMFAKRRRISCPFQFETEGQKGEKHGKSLPIKD